MRAYDAVPLNEDCNKSIHSQTTIPFGGEANPPPADDTWLRQQNAELQRQLKEAMAKLDQMSISQPVLRRLPAAAIFDTSIFATEDTRCIYWYVYVLCWEKQNI